MSVGHMVQSLVSINPISKWLVYMSPKERRCDKWLSFKAREARALNTGRGKFVAREVLYSQTVGEIPLRAAILRKES